MVRRISDFVISDKTIVRAKALKMELVAATEAYSDIFEALPSRSASESREQHCSGILRRRSKTVLQCVRIGRLSNSPTRRDR